jgi:hypothetical protein
LPGIRGSRQGATAKVGGGHEKLLAGRQEPGEPLVQGLRLRVRKATGSEESQGELPNGGVPGSHRGSGRLDVVARVREVVGSGGRKDNALPGGAEEADEVCSLLGRRRGAQEAADVGALALRMGKRAKCRGDPVEGGRVAEAGPGGAEGRRAAPVGSAVRPGAADRNGNASSEAETTPGDCKALIARVATQVLRGEVALVRQRLEIKLMWGSSDRNWRGRL